MMLGDTVDVAEGEQSQTSKANKKYDDKIQIEASWRT